MQTQTCTLREVNVLAESLGFNNPSTHPRPVVSREGLAPIAKAIASAKPGTTLRVVNWADGSTAFLVVTAWPTEREHSWYPGVRVFEVAVRPLQGRKALVLCTQADSDCSSLGDQDGRGLPKRLTSVVTVS